MNKSYTTTTFKFFISCLLILFGLMFSLSAQTKKSNILVNFGDDRVMPPASSGKITWATGMNIYLLPMVSMSSLEIYTI